MGGSFGSRSYFVGADDGARRILAVLDAQIAATLPHVPLRRFRSGSVNQLVS
jgi:hypothetical protein